MHMWFESLNMYCRNGHFETPPTQLSTESSVDSLIRMEVAQVIRDGCRCDFQESFISQGVLVCDQQEPTQIVYRANITSYGSYSADQLVGYIEDWVKQGAIITTGVVIVSFDPDCPVRINNINDPVCAQPSTSAIIMPSTSAVSPSSTLSAPNTLVIITASVSVVVIITAVTTADD